MHRMAGMTIRVKARHAALGMASLAALMMSLSARATWREAGQPPSRDQPPPAAPIPPVVQPPEKAVPPRDETTVATAIFRAPLIREGSAITDAPVRIERDNRSGSWTLLIDQTDARLPQQELILLPCTQLSQMEHLVQASPDRMVKFQMSGRVFVFRGRNYLLPTYAPVLPQGESSVSGASAESASDDAQREDGAAPDDPSAAPATSEPPRSKGGAQRAADIMRDLERSAGPMPRPSTSPAPSGGESGAGPRVRPSSPSSADERESNRKLLPEETQIVNRRGKITRDSGGGWMFVFDADASGLADPPMRLLPCLLLERIEDYARRTGNNSPALLSGPVYLYEGQNYLLPTVFRIPAERRNITP